MHRLIIAFQAFFRALFNGDAARRIEQALAGERAPAPVSATPPPKPAPPAPKPPAQSDAITLLAALQREARLVDFLQEDLAGYSDEQIGAAVREVQRDSGKVLERIFALRAIVPDGEGSPVDLPADFDAGRYRLTGKVGGAGPYHGIVQHHGWEATKIELPSYTGSPSAAKTIAPAEVEIA
jgi:hypothetical protein